MATLLFSGSLGDELNIIPIVRVLSFRNNGLTVRTRFSELFSRNPYVIHDQEDTVHSHPLYVLRFAVGKELEKHMMDHYADLVGIKLENREMDLYLDMDPNSDDAVTFPMHIFERRKVIAIDPKAGWPSRQWGYDRWTTLVDELKKRGHMVIEIGATWRNCFGELLNQRLSNVNYSFVDRLTIRQTAYVLTNCSTFIGNDSGCSHLAAAVGIPSVTLYGPINPRSRKHPTTVPIYAGSCSKCNLMTHSEKCPEGHHNCMEKIQVQDVLDKIDKFLGGLQ